MATETTPAARLASSTVVIKGYRFDAYTRAEAVGHFRAQGDASPDVYECLGQWANANDGEAVYSSEVAAAAADSAARGDDAWCDDASYIDAQTAL